jgi:hypothetical protein
MIPACQLDRGRLSKLLGMLGSDHDGEVVSAARMANQRARRAGLTWTEILAHWERGFLSSLLIRRRPLSEIERVEKFAAAPYSSIKTSEELQ